MADAFGNYVERFAAIGTEEPFFFYENVDIVLGIQDDLRVVIPSFNEKLSSFRCGNILKYALYFSLILLIAFLGQLWFLVLRSAFSGRVWNIRFGSNLNDLNQLGADL